MAKGASWVVKSYPVEAVQKLEALVESTKVERDALDTLDNTIATHEAPDADTVREWARKAAGYGNKFRKISTRLEATVRNAEAGRYVEIMLECEANGLDFADGKSKMDASNYVAEIRKARNLFQGYTESADNIISICRLHLGQQALSLTNDVS